MGNKGELISRIVRKFMGQTRNDREPRTFGGLIQISGDYLGKSPIGIALSKMNLLTKFHRKPNEGLMVLLGRFAEIHFALRKSWIVPPAPLMFRKVLASMAAAQPQLGISMSALESKGIARDVAELKRISVKILETPFLESPDIILAGGRVDSEAENPESEERCAGHDVEFVESFPNPDGEVFVRSKLQSPNNKPKGVKENALQSAQNRITGE